MQFLEKLGKNNEKSSSVAIANGEKPSPIAVANNEIGLKLLSEVSRSSNENQFISPLSISTAYGMLYAGAKGTTAKELRRVLGYDTTNLDDETVHKDFKMF